MNNNVDNSINNRENGELTENELVDSGISGRRRESLFLKAFVYLKSRFPGVLDTVIATIILGSFGLVLSFHISSTRMETILEYIKDDVDAIPEMEKEIVIIRNDVDTTTRSIEKLSTENNDNYNSLKSEFEKEIGRLDSDMDSLERHVFMVAQMSEHSANYFGMQYQKEEDAFRMGILDFQKDDDVATDRKTMRTYSAEDLYNKKIIIPYVQDGKEFIFYGQFNENNQWDGDCLINVYENNNLHFIMEAEYCDGEVLSYKQVMPDTTKRGKDVWVVSERVCEGKIKDGDTWNYIREDNYEKDFLLEYVEAKDLLTVDYFKYHLTTPLEAFYHGYTANGLYNDTTGDAYLVKYAEDGTIRTLYKGNFKDALFHDTTGDAWYIVRNESEKGSAGDYMYYNGTFLNDARADELTEKNSAFPLTKDTFDKILEGNAFKADMVWAYEHIRDSSASESSTTP